MNVHATRTPLLWACTGLVALLLTGPVSATPLHYGGTGNYYEFIRAGGITWTDANQQAPGHSYHGYQGYLATISSQGENDFLYQNFGTLFWEGWLGGWQELHSLPADNWHWVTGEPWIYTNWAPGEPNDAGGTGEECYLQMWGYGTVAPGHWNDDADDTQPGNIGGYLVEYGPYPVPEPSTLALMGAALGAAGFWGLHRRRRRA